MIATVLGTTRTGAISMTGTAIIAACMTFGCMTSAAAQSQCHDLFKPEVETTKSRTEELSAKVTIDTLTKQQRVEGFVGIRGDRELYVDYIKPAPGKPTIVLVNGLTYRTGIWDSFVKQLKGDGLGILRFDPMGMGETMKKYGIPKESIELVDQVKDMNSLLNSLGIREPVHVLGLSYGGGMAIMFGAMYPGKVASLILEAPLTGPLPKLESDIRSKIAMTRIMFPYNRATDAELYNFFLQQIVYTTYPLTEPIVLEHPYKLENVFRMTQGTISFRAGDFVSRLPKGKVHLVVADKDQYIPAEILDGFWQSIPKNARASRLFLQHSEHKIPEAMPHFSAEWVKLIISGDARIQKGATWEGGVWLGGVKSDTTTIEIK